MAAETIERIRLEHLLPEPISHYTDAVRAGDTIWVSGLMALDRDGELVGGNDPVTQTEQIFKTLGSILEHVGASFDDVVKVTVYLIDIHHRAPINGVRRCYFGESRPASTLVGVSALAHPDALVEIEAAVYAPRS